MLGKLYGLFNPGTLVPQSTDSKKSVNGNEKRDLSKTYRIFVPGETLFSGTRSEASSPAARIIPLLSNPNIFAG